MRFLVMELDEPVPDHSANSQLLPGKFSGKTVFQYIFDEIVSKCIEAGIVTGKPNVFFAILIIGLATLKME